MKKICFCTMLIMAVLCTTAYALSDKQNIEIDVDMNNANISIDGKLDSETAFHEATLTLLAPGKTVADLEGLSSETSFTDVITGYYQASVDTAAAYEFEDFKLYSNSGWHTVIVSVDNGMRYELSKFLPDQAWISTLKSDMGSNMYQSLENNKDALIDITDIDIYYSFDSATKTKIVNEVVGAGLGGDLADIIKRITKLSIREDMIATKSGAMLEQYLFPEESDITEEYASVIKEVINISDSSSISTISKFLSFNTVERKAILEKAAQLDKQNIADVINSLNISVIEYRISKVGNWAEIFGIIEAHKDTLTTLNFETYKTSSKRSDIDKSLMTKSFLNTDALSSYINTELTTQTPSGNDFGQNSGGGGGGGGGASKDTDKGDAIAVGSTQPTIEENKTKYIFNDLDNYSWAREAIEYLYDKGIVVGTGDGSYSPNAQVTREAFVKMLVMATNINIDGACDFEDVSKNAWYYKYVAAAVKAGIVHGYSKERFGIGEAIKREDMAVMIAGIIGDVSDVYDEAGYADYSEISGYAKESVSKVKALGIINGYDNNTFAPKDFCTRAQAAMVIYNLIKVGGYNG